MTMKRSKEKFDFKAFGQAIKAARKAKGISRNQLADTLNIAPRYIASIEKSGQHPSLQILYELVTLLDVSVDQFFFPERKSRLFLPLLRNMRAKNSGVPVSRLGVRNAACAVLYFIIHADVPRLLVAVALGFTRKIGQAYQGAIR